MREQSGRGVFETVESVARMHPLGLVAQTGRAVDVAMIGDVEPLGPVVHGHGNDGESGAEGARRGQILGTYLHGPLLPKNVWFADELIARSVGVTPDQLTKLDDRLEDAAHASARRAATRSAPRHSPLARVRARLGRG